MLEGSKAGIGDTAEFEIEQDFTKKEDYYPMNAELGKRLESENLTVDFDALTPSRKKDILKYLGYIKTEGTLRRNIDKVIAQLQQHLKDVRVP